MHARKLSLANTLLLFVLCASTTVLAADDAIITHTHRGTVVTVGADKLVTQGLSGQKKQHVYDVDPAVNVICEGKPCALTDLKAGEQVTVTTEKPQDGKAKATRIEAQKTGS